MTTNPKTPALQLARSRKTGEIVSIYEVPPGKPCDCVSIGCNRPLIARNRGKSPDQPIAPNERTAHFALYNPDGRPEPSPESAIHHLAKEVFADTRLLTLPVESDRDEFLFRTTASDLFHSLTHKFNLPAHHPPQELHHLERQLIAEAFAPFENLHAAMKQHMIWSEVKLEHRMETPAGPVVVDALAKSKSKSNPNPTFRPLAVEFCNTHPVDPEKLARLRSAGIPTLEISISDIPPLTPEGLPNRPGILARLRDPDAPAKRWINEPHNDSFTTRCLEHFQRLATEALTTLKIRLEKEIDPRHFFHLKNHGFKPRKVYDYWVGPGERVRDVYCPQPNTTKVDPDETCTTCPHFGGYNLFQKLGDKNPTRSVMCGLSCPRF